MVEYDEINILGAVLVKKFSSGMLTVLLIGAIFALVGEQFYLILQVQMYYLPFFTVIPFRRFL